MSHAYSTAHRTSVVLIRHCVNRDRSIVAVRGTATPLTIAGGSFIHGAGVAALHWTPGLHHISNSTSTHTAPPVTGNKQTGHARASTPAIALNRTAGWQDHHSDVDKSSLSSCHLPRRRSATRAFAGGRGERSRELEKYIFRVNKSHRGAQWER